MYEKLVDDQNNSIVETLILFNSQVGTCIVKVMNINSLTIPHLHELFVCEVGLSDHIMVGLPVKCLEKIVRMKVILDMGRAQS